MYASKHVIFVGPGPVPADLGLQLPVERGVTEPRPLAFFESAAEAEHAADLLQRRRVRVLVAGPEQPPAESLWLDALRLERDGASCWVGLRSGPPIRFNLRAIEALTCVLWHGAHGTGDAPERGLLLASPELDRPVFVRDRLGGPLDAVLALCGQELQTSARVRSRRLLAAPGWSPPLEGDLLPLAVSVVHELDTRRGELPGRPRW